ncbi:hypothetical protein [Dyadobacter sp. CY356]|uniref:hypothetical protein n=1 Tax=Dyadobacter sp. CY356 TaxID=2906442 RepID=UPI001F22A4B6|nr:hypothetical protein [Dyadobacter sp. CY356]MCF0055375.1 hypothetical protein [Dyadobacter sp. CY356]
MNLKTTYLFLLFASILISCNQKPESPFPVHYKRIALTAYAYLENDSVPKRKDFYVSSFWQIDSLGKCEMIRRDGLEKDQKYYVDNLPDSTIQLINGLNFSKLDTSNLHSSTNGKYDGYKYCLAIYKSDGSATEYINFIPPALHGELLKLFNTLSKLMAEANTVGMFPASYYQNINYIKKNLSDTTTSK